VLHPRAPPARELLPGHTGPPRLLNAADTQGMWGSRTMKTDVLCFMQERRTHTTMAYVLLPQCIILVLYLFVLSTLM